MDIKNKIEQFFNATLTLEEEQELYRYLCNNDVPAELQRDKEAVLALLEDTNDYTLPSGAEQRLVEMLDSLEEQQACEASHSSEPRKISLAGSKASKYSIRDIWKYVAVAATVAIVVAVSVPFNDATEQDGYAMYEQDTFDTPEEAMLCAGRSFNELLLAVNSTQRNVQEIENVLEYTAVKCAKKGNE